MRDMVALRIREARTRYELTCSSVVAKSLAFTKEFGKPDQGQLRYNIARKMDSAAEVLGLLLLHLEAKS